MYRKSALLAVSHLGASVCMAAGLCVLAVIGRYFFALIIFFPVPVLFLMSRFTENVYRELIRKSTEEKKAEDG